MTPTKCPKSPLFRHMDSLVSAIWRVFGQTIDVVHTGVILHSAPYRHVPVSLRNTIMLASWEAANIRLSDADHRRTGWQKYWRA